MTTGTTEAPNTFRGQYASREFWVGMLDRTIATMAQTMVVVLTADVSGLLEVDWLQFFSVVGLSGVAAIATAFAYPKRVISGEESAEQTAQHVEEKLREAFNKDGILINRETSKFSSFGPRKVDGTYYTRKELRLEREAEANDSV